MRYMIRCSETGKNREITEREVRDLIINDFRHDIAVISEYTDEEIAKQVNETDIDYFFHNDAYESNDFTIKRH
jgi:hypothetical protein